MFNFKIILGNKYHKAKKDKRKTEQQAEQEHNHAKLEKDCPCVSNEEDEISKK